MKNTGTFLSKRAGSKPDRSKKSHTRETEKRSDKKNNYRKPPTKRKKRPVNVSDESISKEVHKSSDENNTNIPSVRVLQRRRVIVFEDDPDEEDEGEDNAEHLDELDDDDDDETDNMEVDEDDNMDFRITLFVW
jgi:hypothetical protein